MPPSAIAMGTTSAPAWLRRPATSPVEANFDRPMGLLETDWFIICVVFSSLFFQSLGSHMDRHVERWNCLFFTRPCSLARRQQVMSPWSSSKKPRSGVWHLRELGHWATNCFWQPKVNMTKVLVEPQLKKRAVELFVENVSTLGSCSVVVQLLCPGAVQWQQRTRGGFENSFREGLLDVEMIEVALRWKILTGNALALSSSPWVVTPKRPAMWRRIWRALGSSDALHHFWLIPSDTIEEPESRQRFSQVSSACREGELLQIPSRTCRVCYQVQQPEGAFALVEH